MNSNKGFLQQFLDCKSNTQDKSACYFRENKSEKEKEKEKSSLELIRNKQVLDFENNKDSIDTLYAESDKSKPISIGTGPDDDHPFSKFKKCLTKKYEEILFIKSLYNFTILIHLVKHMNDQERYPAFINNILATYEDPSKKANKEISCKAYNKKEDLFMELNFLIENTHARFEMNGKKNFDMILVLDLGDFNYFELKKLAENITSDKVSQLVSMQDKWHIIYKKFSSTVLVFIYLVFKCFWNYKYGGESIQTLESIDEVILSYSNLIQYQFLSVDMILDFMKKYTSQLLYFWRVFVPYDLFLFVGFDYMMNVIVFLYNILTTLSNFDNANVNSQNPINFGIMQVSTGQEWWDSYLSVADETSNNKNTVMESWVKVFNKSTLYYNTMMLNKQELVDNQSNYYYKFALVNKTFLVGFDLWYILTIRQPQYILSDFVMVLSDAEISKTFFPQMAKLALLRFDYDSDPYFVNDGTFDINLLISNMRKKLVLVENSALAFLYPKAIKYMKDLDYLFRMYENNLLYDFEFLSLYIWLRDMWRTGDQVWSNYSLMVYHNAPNNIVASRTFEDRIYLIYYNGLGLAPDSIRNQVLNTDESSPGLKWKETAMAADAAKNNESNDNKRFKRLQEKEEYIKAKKRKYHNTKTNRYKAINRINDINLIGQKYKPYKFDDIVTKNILAQVNNKVFSLDYQFADIINLLKLENTRYSQNENNLINYKTKQEQKISGLETEISNLKKEQQNMKALIQLILKKQNLLSIHVTTNQ